MKLKKEPFRWAVDLVEMVLASYKQSNILRFSSEQKPTTSQPVCDITKEAEVTSLDLKKYYTASFSVAQQEKRISESETIRMNFEGNDK